MLLYNLFIMISPKLRTQIKKLSMYSWYDKNSDTLECLVCWKHCKSLGSHVIKWHWYETANEYKKEFWIQIWQNLESESTLMKKNEIMMKWRENWKMNVFSKWETSIPEEYQKASNKWNNPSHWINRKLSSDRMKWIPKSQSHIKKMAENSKKQFEEWRHKLTPFIKWRKAFNKGKSYEEFLWEEEWIKFKMNLSLPVARYSIEWTKLDEFFWINEASRITWIHASSINCVCNWKRNRKTAWWFIWKFI